MHISNTYDITNVTENAPAANNNYCNNKHAH